MTQRHTPAELPLHVTDEEKIELERGRRLLEAMIDIVRRTRSERNAQSEEVSCND